MDPFEPTPRALSPVEQAVRTALEHASALGDHETVTELAAILRTITLRQQMPAAWDTVPATGRMQ